MNLGKNIYPWQVKILRFGSGYYSPRRLNDVSHFSNPLLFGNSNTVGQRAIDLNIPPPQPQLSMSCEKRSDSPFSYSPRSFLRRLPTEAARFVCFDDFVFGLKGDVDARLWRESFF